MVFMKRWINHLLLTVFCLTSLPVMASESTELTKLQAEMLRLISTDEIEQFTKVTEQLKEESKKQGDASAYSIKPGEIRPSSRLPTRTTPRLKR